MKFNFIKVIIAFFLLISLNAYAQKNEIRIDKEFPQEKAFFNSFFGDYSGNLKMSNGEGVLTNIAVEFAFKPTKQEGVFAYHLIYLTDGKREVQSHILKTLEKKKGLYMVESQDETSFPATMIDHTLYSTFLINENIMTTELEFNINGKIYLRITRSGKTLLEKNNGEDKQDIYGYYVNLYQTASFQKKTKD